MRATDVGELIEAAAKAADLGTPSARKVGRNPRWPYVPVINWTDDTGARHWRQVIGRAYATRDEAVEAAERHLAAFRVILAKRLAVPANRALREQYGLPRELVDLKTASQTTDQETS